MKFEGQVQPKGWTDSIYITQGLMECIDSSRSHLQTLALWGTRKPTPFQKEAVGVDACALAVVMQSVSSPDNCSAFLFQ